MEELEEQIIQFKHWHFNPALHELKNTTDSQILTLEAKQSDLLAFIINQNGDIVSREQLMAEVWDNRFVDIKTINATISRLRKILGGEKDSYIKTHPKLGYSFACQAFYIDRPTTEKIQLKQQEKSNLKVFKYYAIAITSILFVVLYLLLINIKAPIKNLEANDIKIEPLTYMDGWELYPSLSSDNNLLAFVNLTDENSIYHVTVQDMETKQTAIIEPTIETSYAIWAPNSRDLYYTSYEDKHCWVKKTTINNELAYSPPVTITSCGIELESNSLALTQDNQWLYYVERTTVEASNTIKRIHLQTLENQTITSPPVNFAGDSHLSLSKNDQRLAFIRYFDNSTNNLMVYDIFSGEITTVVDETFDIKSIEWLPNSTSILFIDETNNTNKIKIVDINSKEIYPLLKYPEGLFTPEIVNNNEVLVSIGDFFQADIKAIELDEGNAKIKNLISSSFKDHSADIFTQDGNKMIAFASSRSGSYQIWLQKLNSLTQLTNFEQGNYLTELKFSPSGEKLLFKTNGKLHILDLKTNTITPIVTTLELIRNAIWECSSDNKILMVSKESNRWQLFSVNLEKDETTLLVPDVVTIDSDCNNKRYYIAKHKQPGLFGLNLDKTLINDFYILNEMTFYDKANWAIENNILYKINVENFLFQVNLTNLTQNTYELKNLNVLELSINNNLLFFSNIKPKNTYIGKIIIPELLTSSFAD